MARQCNAFQVTFGSGAPGVLQKPIRINPNRKCTRIRCRATMVVANSGAAYNMTAANLVTLAAALFANFYLAFGDTDVEVVDANHPFSLMRYLYAVMENKDFTVQIGNNGQSYAINAVTGTNIQIGASGNTTLVMEFVRSFTWVRGAKQLHDNCPGTSQMQQLNLSITPSTTSPTFNTGAVTVSTASIVVIFEDMPTKADNPDPYARVIRIRETTTQGTDVPLPLQDGGAPIHIADLSTAALSTVLTLFNIFADGMTAIQGIISAAQALNEWEQDLPLGAFDASTLGTPLYTTPVIDDLESLDKAQQLIFNQPNNDITSPQLVVIFFPAWTKSAVNQAGGNLSKTKQGYVALGSGAATSGDGTDPATGSVTPLAVLDPSTPQASLVPTVRFSPGSTPTTIIPPHLTAGAMAAAASKAGGSAGVTGSAVLASAAQSLAAVTPGATLPTKIIANQPGVAMALSQITAKGVGSSTTAAATAGAAANRVTAVR
ncbi:MAG TPA: hypothetical protein VMB05_18375 [Solirubrobacteraceae bacterium]|nr:hypothetical protein [Solirubrobacteraceae bacterium]